MVTLEKVILSPTGITKNKYFVRKNWYNFVKYLSGALKYRHQLKVELIISSNFEEVLLLLNLQTALGSYREFSLFGTKFEHYLVN